MRRLLILFAIVIVTASAASAQRMTIFSYNVSVPSGDTRDYIGDASWRGFSVDLRWFRGWEGPVAFGFSFAWHVFSADASGTTQLENATVTGVQRRYINSFPFLLTAYYYTGESDTPRLYVGGGAGAYKILQRIELGVNAFEADNWHFGFQPEVGFQFPFGDMEGNINVRYNYAVKSGESLNGDGVDYQYWGFSGGLVWDW